MWHLKQELTLQANIPDYPSSWNMVVWDNTMQRYYQSVNKKYLLEIEELFEKWYLE